MGVQQLDYPWSRSWTTPVPLLDHLRHDGLIEI
jgi:hypothetical protein